MWPGLRAALTGPLAALSTAFVRPGDNSINTGHMSLSEQKLHVRETWEDGTLFRDCNGESNGLELPLRELQAELVEKNAGREVADDNLLGLEGLWIM